ncbi:MAG: 3-deoxy-D-manno-octulosonic acid transferase [SAR324 cluster bacterium]|nr:3-deoxy-D-manno-octulosonic acid transferase [SAR324 cluster bacterium]MBL7034873.1 3-deoxy-D-manno-octulosonic acid transferase [SAR324 cluster bacterium]
MTQRFWFLIYNLILLPLLLVIAKILSPFKTKIRDSFEKREGLWERLENNISKRDWQKPLIWFHVASAGELLQAQPLIVRCLAEGTECALTYSSVNAFYWLQRPEQTETQNLLLAEFLALDKIRNVRLLLALLQPSRIVWVSYDLWPNLVWEAHRQKIPQSLISAIVHAGSLRTANFAGRSFYNSLYCCLEQILTVSEADKTRILTAIPEHPKVEVMGDTRCDSVLERRDKLKLPKLPPAVEDGFIFVAGSTWPQDETCIFSGLQEALKEFPDLFLILAPHEPTEEHLQNAETFFAAESLLRWSHLSSATDDLRILLIDSVGILAGLYHSAKMAYVGGAFTTGVHNILEPAAMGATVAFGPKHSNSMEALQMKEQKLASSVLNSTDFKKWLFDLLNNREKCIQLGQQSKVFVEAQAGAAELCVPHLMAGLT